MSTSNCGALAEPDEKTMTKTADDVRSETGLPDGQQELADEFTAVLVIAIANKLTRGASKFYRTNWNIGVVEFRILMCLRPGVGRAIGDIAEAADVDKGAVSRAVKVLVDMGLVDTAAAARRVNEVTLTRTGERLARELRSAGRAREARLLSPFDAKEKRLLLDLLKRLSVGVDLMNEEDR